MSNLETIIKHAIVRQPERHISFHAFMHECLYHPELGYYMQPDLKIGREGDFYTSSSVHPVFGQAIGQFCLRLAAAMSRPLNFLEMGAGNGSFARSFLQALRHDTQHNDTVAYTIQEKSPALIEQQHRQLQDVVGQVSWVSSLQDVTGYEGIIFSNELVDAFPVHIVERRQEGMFEVVVEVGEDNRLRESLFPLDNQELLSYMKRHRLRLRVGQRLEVPLDAERWARDVALHINRGIWLTIDYGLRDEEFRLPQYRHGTLRCFRNHRLDDRPLESPGEKDITAHVHFDALARTAQSSGWEKVGLFSQTEFLLTAGILNLLTEHASTDPFSAEARKNRAIRQLISPGGMSDTFRVLVLTKDVPPDVHAFFQPFSFRDV